PAVPVVPVPRAAWCLRQRGRRRCRDGAGGREGQALERKGAAGEMAPPPVVRKPAPGKPVLPVVRGPHLPVIGVLVTGRCAAAAPGQRAEPGVALLEQGP